MNLGLWVSDSSICNRIHCWINLCFALDHIQESLVVSARNVDATQHSSNLMLVLTREFISRCNSKGEIAMRRVTLLTTALVLPVIPKGDRAVSGYVVACRAQSA